VSLLRRIAILAAVTFTFGLAAAPASQAGQYTVNYCANGAGAERWNAYATAPGMAAVECSTAGRMRITMNGSQYWNQGSAGVLSFTAPEGTAVVGWQPNFRYKVTKYGEDTERFRVAIGPTPFRFDATTCINTLCPDVINGPVAVDPPAGTIEARVSCVDEVVGQSNCRFESELIDYGGTITLQDDTAPTLRGAIDGRHRSSRHLAGERRGR
jgi:hypothetical protein